ncbi:MAG: DUF1257 domain-containing protein [Deltaproteobacteria bacterium]|nr:DUF1257 domain-containing protein [Deltaproteobacteria bacterium]
MSHFTSIKLEIRDRGALVAALKDLDIGEVEAFDRPQAIHGFGQRTRKVDIAVRGAGYYGTDIGFRRTADGRYEAVLDHDDQRQLGDDWRQRLLQRYGRHVAVARLANKGFRVVREEVRNGKLHLLAGRVR